MKQNCEMMKMKKPTKISTGFVLCSWGGTIENIVDVISN